MTQPDETLLFLPNEPLWGHYEVEQVSPLVQRVWLVHDRVYDFACGKQVRTIWGFIKGKRVHPPLDHSKMRVKSVCDLVDAYTLGCYTTIVPKTTDLTHLL